MRYRDEQKRRTRKACGYAFVLTLCVLLTGIGLLMADHATGRALHGNGYATVLPAVDDAWVDYLPARVQVLLRIPQWEQRAAEWVWEQVKE